MQGVPCCSLRWALLQHLELTLPGITRLSMPIRSFLSSCSFWKFSILIIVPCNCATISVISASAAEGGRQPRLAQTGPPAQCSRMALSQMLCLSQCDKLQACSILRHNLLGIQGSAGWEEAQVTRMESWPPGALYTGAQPLSSLESVPQSLISKATLCLKSI